MGSIEFGSGFEGVSLASIVLGIVFLTVPGVATAIGLSRFRKPAPRSKAAAVPRPGGENPRGRASRRPAAAARTRKRSAGNWIASVLTVGALLWAGLGLVPLTKALYRAIERRYEYGAAVVGLIALVLLLAKGIAMARDLKDGKVDHPMLWLAPVPLLAMLFWAAPVVFGQITDQAGQTGQAIFGGSGNSDDGAPSKQAHDKTPKGERRGQGSGQDRAGERR
jgi:hypothetical protein